jgi:uncharacterized repeat protein (TIGR01451 family)
MRISADRKGSILAPVLVLLLLASLAALPAIAAPTKKLYRPSISPTSAPAGSAVSYQLTLTNDPTSTQSFASAEVSVPNGFTVDPASLSVTPATKQWTATLNSSASRLCSAPVCIELRSPAGSTSAGAVAPGSSVVLNFTATADCTQAGPHTWVTVVKQSNDFQGTNNDFSKKSGYSDPTVSVGTPVSGTCVAQLSVTKTADATSVTAGDTVGYTIAVTNDGQLAATNVAASDTLPTDAGLSWSIDRQGLNGATDGTACGTDLSGGTLTCTIPTLAGGSNYSVHITSLTDPTTVADSPIDNTVNVTADNGGPVQASASIEVWQGQLGCPSIQDQGFEYTATTSGDGPSLGQLARLENLNGTECVAKLYNFDSLLDQDASVISFTEGSVAGQEQAQFVMQIDWDPAIPTTATQTFTTTVAGKTTFVQYTPDDQEHAIQWCTAVQYDEGGNVVTATLPTRVDPGHEGEPENWCLVSQNAAQQSDGKVAVTEVLYGFGDPTLRR